MGDEPVEVFSPRVVEYLIASLGEWTGWCGAVLMPGLGEDGQFPEGARAVCAMSEGFFPVMLAAQAHQIPLGRGATELRLLEVEREDVVHVAIVGVDSASGMTTRAVSHADAFGERGSDEVLQ